MKRHPSFRDALAAIPDGARVFVHGGGATPMGMLDCLATDFPDRTDLEFIHIHTEGSGAYADHPNFKVKSLFVGKNLRHRINYEDIDYIPCFLSEIPLLFRRGVKPLDVALIQVSPPDQHGYVSLGVSVDIAKAAVDTAKMIIAHINPQMPRVHGSGFIHSSQITHAVEQSAPIYTKKFQDFSSTEDLIGQKVAELVEDGATIQLGIGAIPDAVARHLRSHKNLGLHTEMWSDGALDLIKRGVIDNSKKKFYQGISTSSFVIGSRELYDYIDDNMSTVNLESDYVNFPINVIRNPKVTAINSSVEIDLTGQVCSDSIGHRIISGVGGQMDFMRSAALSEGGKPIIAISSTTKGGVSRITPSLNLGAGVVTTRAHVHWVVTEYGAVNLYGKSLNERACALISIAHPDHREALEMGWSEIKRTIRP